MKIYDQYRVPIDKLKKVCNEEELKFCNSTLDVSPLDAIAGQERAVKSMEFGIAMDDDGYHIFVVGPSGTGKSEYTRDVINRAAALRPVPADWCYIYNFSNKDKPLAVSLPPGDGRIFQKDMDHLIIELKNAIRKNFESTDYELKKDRIFNTYQLKMEELVMIINQKAFEDGFGVKTVGMKFVFIPLYDGRPYQPEEYNSLSDEQRNIINEKRYLLVKKLERILADGQQAEKKMTAQIIELTRETAFRGAEPLIISLKEKYQKSTRILEYLDNVLHDVADRYGIFTNQETLPANHQPDETKSQEGDGDSPVAFNGFASQVETDPYSRYRVNLFINNENLVGAPVITEPNPYYYNIFGKIEYKSQLFLVNTDFTMVKPGAVHLANGGYLVLQAKDLLTDPFVWNVLKKMLRNRAAVVENIGEQYRTVPTVTLKPEAIPLNIKVILIGSPLYYLILSSDEDFRELFKVKVDFDSEMPRNQENIRKYVSFVSGICEEKDVHCFDQTGLAGIIEYGSRLAGSQKKLSTRFGDVREVIYESIARAKSDGSETVSMVHVKKAINDRKYRFNRLEEKIQEEIVDRRIIIDTTGMTVGQINGLFIIQAGGYTFGLPSRITAVTHVGHGGVVNIERETEMSGNVHSKGVLTLAGYLGGKFAQDKPLGLTAQITFEQLYDGVEGDSASSAELYAIISSLAGVGIRQCLAVTGSVDQRGEIQPIGGVNEKIEGFFDICQADGLTGEQGVIIPASNTINLMLKDEVVEAAKQGLFNIYAINHIEEGLEILTGIPAGKMDADGNYPEGSIYDCVNKKLQGFNTALESATGKITG